MPDATGAVVFDTAITGTTIVTCEVADAEPPGFFAVTIARNVLPTS